MKSIDAYPLQWPQGWKRSTNRRKAPFQPHSFGRARDELFHQLKLMGIKNSTIVLSSNITLRRDGLPYSGMAQPKDTGIAVYFTHRDRPMVFACDTYEKVEDNLWALRQTIEALRGIERWGASTMLERAFTGFAALPPAQSAESCWDILGLNDRAPADQIKDRFRALAQQWHPDKPGGSTEKMARLNKAYEEAMRGK